MDLFEAENALMLAVGAAQVSTITFRAEGADDTVILALGCSPFSTRSRCGSTLGLQGTARALDSSYGN
jgi:hypothetical protein